MAMFAKEKEAPRAEPQMEPIPPGHGVPAAQAAGGPPAALLEEMEKDSGQGISTKQSDNIIPLLYVLTTNSPQVAKQDQKYVEGATAGDIWLRGADNPIINGEEGVLFQPAHFEHELWIEWGPERGKGFVARHIGKDPPAEARKDKDKEGKEILRMPNGNVVVQTRQVTGLVHMGDLRLPYVIPFTGTGHTVCKDWNSNIANHPLRPGKLSAARHHLYRLHTRYRSNDKGAWYLLDPRRVGWIENAADMAMGRQLFEAVKSGEKQAEAEIDTGGDTSEAPF